MPSTFPLVPRYERKDIRRRVHGAYQIFYRIDGELVHVIRALHGARDYEALLK
jgi:toxin ParE1/3/4